MDFISNQTPQIESMLAAIGVASIDELFASVPLHLRLQPPKDDDGLSEFEGLKLMEALAAKNTFQNYDSYLGAGAYEHHVPAIVGAICSRSEFLTSYTPYQAEASQGMLQAIFEFQSAICGLTGMDVANASVYDGASACAEAVLMTLRLQENRSHVLVSGALHPHYREVIEQYLSNQNVEIETIPFLADGSIDRHAFDQKLSENTAGVIFQSPNFFGVIEQIESLTQLAKQKGALSILCANPLSYGLFKSALELGVDIAVGDCQPLGLTLSFGGPYAGYMACREELVRQLPGRLVSETTDTEGRQGYVLTLQAREQHIRREKATSNICTNQALAALASLVAILWYGKKGFYELALTNYQRSNYLRKQLQNIKGINIQDKAPIFNEFVMGFDQPIDQVLSFFRNKGIEPGIVLERYYPSLKNCLLVAVTETKTLEQLNRFVSVAKEAVEHV